MLPCIVLCSYNRKLPICVNSASEIVYITNMFFFFNKFWHGGMKLQSFPLAICKSFQHLINVKCSGKEIKINFKDRSISSLNCQNVYGSNLYMM